jgi:CheY-like chemotaxis protein
LNFLCSNGIELAERVRARPYNVAPKLVLVTAYGREEVMRSAEQMGIGNVLVKPVNGSVLFDSVTRIFSTAQFSVRETPMEKSEVTLAVIRGAKVLLVEDNELNQEVATELLRAAGLVVDVAENGQIAVDMVQAGQFDAVLMDVQMPVMDGITATRILRGMPEFDALPIIAMTANAMQSDREACRAAGMNDHVSKPIEPRDLFSCLLRWVRHRAPAPDRDAAGPGGQVSQPGRGAGLADPDVPEGILGLDTELGLRRVLGKKSTYLNMLRMFAAGQDGAVDKAMQALEAGDWDTAVRTVHTTKGVCGNIGAAGAQDQAGHLENALKERQPRETLDALAAQLRGTLQPLVEAIAALLPAKAIMQASVAVDEAVLASVTTQLRQLCADMDSGAEDLLVENTAMLHSAFPKHAQAISDAIKSFDFDLAVEQLDAAMQARAGSASV